MNLFSGQQWRRRHREQTLSNTVGEGEGGMNSDSGMETCIIIYKTDSNGKLLYDVGSLGWCSVIP